MTRFSLSSISIKLKKGMRKLFPQNNKRPFKGSAFHGTPNRKNVIFLLPAQVRPAGGSIVAHHQSDSINAIQYKNFSSQVFYPDKVQHLVTKFAHNSSFKRDKNFDINNDFVIIPEMMVCRYAPELIRLGVKYGIHVQNGYSLGGEILLGIANFNELKHIYENAQIIIGNSNDTIENIKTVFPQFSEKIIRSYFVINKSKYQPIENKKNLITYMPRKLGNHSKLVLLFLGDKLPVGWSIKAIDGVTEQQVYDIFYDSKIFLSFSEFEGLAMPPAMAAMCGNRVIGYTGEANKEYFHLPCFEEVYCGDIKDFVKKLLDAVERFDKNQEILDLNSIEYLHDFFSEKNQTNYLCELMDEIESKLT